MCTSSESTNTTNIFDGKFQVYLNVAKDEDGASSCITKTARYGPIGCVHKCAQDIWCSAVYAELNKDTGNDVWRCYVCFQAWDVSALDAGNGSYAVAQYPNRGFNSSLPAMSGADPVGFKMVDGHVTGQYVANGGGHVILVYDVVNHQWPVMDDACWNSFSSKPQIKDLAVTTHQKEDGWYYFDAICPQSEVSYRNFKCRNGAWNFHYTIPFICLPTTCYKVWGARRVYKGTANHSETGKPCTQWSAGWSLDKYLEDEMDRAVAKNYCRDLFSYSYLWCHLEGGDTEQCNQVPEC